MTFASPDNIFIKKFLHIISKNFSGDIENSISENLVQATDNSIYQLIPQAVIYPKNSSDIKLIFKLAQKEEFKNIKFTARGGATGTNGQSLNKGIIIDCIRYFNKIIDINLDEEFVDVEPGLILKNLNDILKIHGYHFAPHISPDDRATIGGMIATDASGKGSYVFGKTSDNLINVETILANGNKYTFENLLISKLNKKAKKVNDLLIKNEKLINNIFPKSKRFVSGYNLLKPIENNNFLKLPYLFAGSEGTLGVITKARLKITKINQFRVLIVTYYDNFITSLKDTQNILKFCPFAIESMDEKILNLATKQKLTPFIEDVVIKDAKNINIIEFQAENSDILVKQVNNFLNNYSKITLAKNALEFYEENQISQIWDLRKSGVGIAGNLPGKRKPIPFIEDSCVKIDKIADYVVEVKELLDSYKLFYVIYGHLDVGCLHIRPALDLKDKNDKSLIKKITPKVIQLVKKYEGVVWGEHSAGFRVGYSKEIFGNEIFNIFCKIKNIFDPENRLNPGKVAGDKLVEIDKNLQADFNKNISDDLTEYFEKAIFCNGNAKCLSIKTEQTMCPSYKVTKQKLHSPKGRANLIRNWLSFKSKNSIPKNLIKKLIYKYKNKNYLKQIYNALAGCLGCKACSNSCPLSVDIPTYRSLFLNWYHKIYNRTLRDVIFSRSEELLSLIAKFPLIAKFTKTFGRLFSINDSPKIHNNFYQSNIQKYIVKKDEKIDKDILLILVDNFTAFGEDNLLKDTITLLEKLQFKVRIIPLSVSGKAYLNSGYIEQFKKIANNNVKLLENYADNSIIVIEPTIYCFLTEEYSKFSKIKFKINLISEFLNGNISKLKKYSINEKNREISIFLHCMEKNFITKSSKYWCNIFSILNFAPKVIDTGCCGMAGNYGYQTECFDNSKKLFDISWQKPLRQSNISVATGFSCRSQIKRFAEFNIKHPIHIINKIISNV